MVKEIALKPIPSQSFSVVVDGNRFAIRLVSKSGIVSADVSRNNEIVTLGQRCVAEKYIIPYPYLEAGGGNFIFLTSEGDLPNYLQFGETQKLFWLSQDEVDVRR